MGYIRSAFLWSLIALFAGLWLASSGCAAGSEPVATTAEPTWEDYDDLYRTVWDFGDGAYELPQIVGDMAALQAELERLDASSTCRRRGVVMIGFVVREDGHAERPGILESLHSNCDRLALEAVSNLEFSPATLDGEPVKFLMRLPVQFTGR